MSAIDTVGVKSESGNPFTSIPTIVAISATKDAVFLDALDTLTIIIADSTMLTTSSARMIIDNRLRFILFLADTAVHNVEGELTIPLKKGEDGEDHYAVGSVSLSMDSKNKDYKKYSETMADMDGIIKDIVFAVMGNYTVDEARTNSEPIKQEILKKIQERFDSTFIYGVSYNFLYN